MAWSAYRRGKHAPAAGALLAAWQEANKSYRQLLKYHKRAHARRQQIQMLECYFSKRPTAFWRVLRGTMDVSMPTDVDAWTEYFEQVFNGTSVDASFSDSAVADGLLSEPSAAAQAALADINDPIALSEVDHVLRRLKLGKAAGPDGITAECLQVKHAAFEERSGGQPPPQQQQRQWLEHTLPSQACSYVLAPLLTKLLNRLFQRGEALLAGLTTSTLTPIYKGKGDNMVFDSYRGIAVGSVLCKVYEMVLNDRLSAKAELLQLRAAGQCGFRPEHGTLDGQFILRHFIDRARAKKKPLYCVFVDFKKAFDQIDRKVLLDVWRRLGVTGPFLAALQQLYDSVRMQIKLKQRLGEPFDTTWGTKQGSVLSPLLFGGMIEQLCRLISQRLPGVGPELAGMCVAALLYADDVALMAEEPGQMQQLLDVLAEFSVMFGMSVSLVKTKGVVSNAGTNRRRVLQRCNWTFQGQSIDMVAEFTYLGTLFHESKGCEAGAAVRAAHSRNAVFSLLGRARSLQWDQSDLLCRLFDQLVEPVLSYGCQIWGPCVAAGVLRPPPVPPAPHVFARMLDRKLVPAEAVQLDFIRYISGLPPCSPKWITLAEFGRRPMLLRWLELTADWWQRLQHTHSVGAGGCMLTVAAFAESVQAFLDDPSQGGWAADFLRCMQWLGVVDDPSACTTLRQVLDLNITELAVKSAGEALTASWWAQHGALHADPRTAASEHVWHSTYCQWVLGAPQPGPAPHMKSFLSYKAKLALVRLRVGGYPLRIATGRNEGSGAANAQDGRALGPRGIPRAARICRLCQAGCVEDLQHFLVECPGYAATRQRWHCVFAGRGSTASVLNQDGQHRVAAAVCDMLSLRSDLLLGI